MGTPAPLLCPDQACPFVPLPPPVRRCWGHRGMTASDLRAVSRGCPLTPFLRGSGHCSPPSSPSTPHPHPEQTLCSADQKALRMGEAASVEPDAL